MVSFAKGQGRGSVALSMVGVGEQGVGTMDMSDLNDALLQVGRKRPSPDKSPEELQDDADIAERTRTLIERLETSLKRRDPRQEEHERVKRENKRLLVSVAAENRRWQQQYHKPGIALPSLLQLAEQALGDAFTKVGDQLRPHYDYCGLKWKPSAVDHNSEHCRIKRHRPAVEEWR